MKHFQLGLHVAGVALGIIFILLVSLPSGTPSIMARRAQKAPEVSTSWSTSGNKIPPDGFLGTKNSQPLIFKTKKVERMRIDAAGSVGIGTTTPGSKLTVAGVIESTGGGIKFPDGTTQTSAVSGASLVNKSGDSMTGALHLPNNGLTVGTNQLFLANSMVGIGTTNPAAPLEVASGRIRLSSGIGDVEFTEVADLIAHTTEANPIPTEPAFRVDTGTGMTRAFTVLNNGNVGIGDPNPGGRLIVKGDGSTFLLRVQNQNGADALKVVTNGVVSFGALYALSSTNHLCYHAPANLALTSCSSAAEYVPTIDVGSGFPGTADLVSIAPDVKNPYGDAHGPFVVQKATTPCDNNLLGFIVKPESGADGVKLNNHYLPLAIYGYFPTHVTTLNGKIKRGDPLTSSTKPGYAMKATGACKIIGYALEDANTDGTIQVFADLGENAASEVGELKSENQQLRKELANLEARLAALEQKGAVTQKVSVK